MSEAMQQAREAVILAVLKDNWYRLTRYDSPEQAEPAMVNVAMEIERKTRPLR